MKLTKYLKDKLSIIVLFIFMYFILLLMLFAFKSPKSLIIGVSVIELITLILIILIPYLKRKTFYDKFLNNLEKLDKKYLIIETLNKPNFYDGELLYNALYEIDKSMLENVKEYELSINDFKDYIEMWIHEVKIPVSCLTLMTHNNKNFSSKERNQIQRLNNYIEQVLYYVRSENAEKDYLIMETNLSKIIGSIALKNKDDLLENNIDLNVSNVDKKVLTDSKWLEFILNQIINNSIKYKSNKDSTITITTKEEENKVLLSITDNGIGIPKEDLKKVFEKSFTGYNGRIKSKSTGMGLYIAKKLCTKLGHKIEIESEKNKYTKVTIIFNNSSLYDVLK